MSFPSADQVSAFGAFLFRSNLSRSIASMRPDLAERVTEGAVDTVTISLPSGHPNAGSKVVVGRVGHGWRSTWTIVGGRPTAIETMTWELETSQDVLAAAALAMYDSCHDDQPPASPWRWSEARESAVVSAADLLSDRGFEIAAVAIENRQIRHWDDSEQVVSISRGRGDSVWFFTDWGVARLALTRSLGWVLDIESMESVQRLDLCRAVGGKAVDSAREAVSAVEAAVDSFIPGAEPSPPAEDLLPLLSMEFAPVTPPAIAATLDRIGIHPQSEDVDIRLFRKQDPVSLGDVQRAFAQSTVAQKKLLVFSVRSFSKGAIKWADEARIPLFVVYGGDADGYGVNDTATEHEPFII